MFHARGSWILPEKTTDRSLTREKSPLGLSVAVGNGLPTSA